MVKVLKNLKKNQRQTIFGIVIDHTSSEEFMGEKFKYFMIKKEGYLKYFYRWSSAKLFIF